MRPIFRCLLLLALLAPAARAGVGKIVLDQMILPVTEDIIEEALADAAAAGDEALLIQLATPGGLETSTRGIVNRILAAELPVVVWVAPSGARAASAGFFILGGYLFIHFFEHVFAPHLHFGEETHGAAVVDTHVTSTALIGLGLHALMDGIAIGAAFVTSPGLGVLVFAAIMLHKLPEGFTIASVMKAAGTTRGWAMGASAVLAVATFAGVLASAVLSEVAPYLLAIATGSVLYVGATDLMSEANKEEGILNPVMVFIGVGMFFVVLGLVRFVGIEV